MSARCHTLDFANDRFSRSPRTSCSRYAASLGSAISSGVAFRMGIGSECQILPGEFGKDKLCRVVVQTAKENPALSPFLSFPFGTQISIFPFLTESRGESVCLRGGHDRRSMLVQVMMTADPLVSVAFYETDPHSNTSTPQVPAWETGVS